MATLTILGKTFEIAPFMFDELEAAAPHIDAINATAGALTTLEGMMTSAKHSLAIIAIGLQKVDASLTLDALKSKISFDDFPVVSAAVADILREAGLGPKVGEVKAPSEPTDAEGASENNSGTSSAN